MSVGPFLACGAAGVKIAAKVRPGSTANQERLDASLWILPWTGRNFS
jgi:hypothetical protein